MDPSKNKNFPNDEESEESQASPSSKIDASIKFQGLDDLTTATMKIAMPQAVDSESEMAIVEKTMGIQGIELTSLPIPNVEKLEGQDHWDKYTIIGVISRQRFRALFLVRDENIHRTAVMKVLLSSPELESDQMQRFLHEAQIQAQLKQPAIIPVYEIGIDIDGQMYYTMPYFPGASLDNCFTCESIAGKRTAFRFLLYFYQICRAVAHIHDRGVLHRNLNPRNIYIVNDGAYLTGWEGCRVKNRGIEVFDQAANHSIKECGQLHTADGRPIGNVHYMAPEVIREKIRYVDERSDIYGLGAILYFIMTGKRPFETPSYAETIELICGKSRKIPRRKNRFPISRAIAHIIEKAMATDRTKRYQTVGELMADLENIF